MELKSGAGASELNYLSNLICVGWYSIVQQFIVKGLGYKINLMFEQVFGQLNLISSWAIIGQIYFNLSKKSLNLEIMMFEQGLHTIMWCLSEMSD